MTDDLKHAFRRLRNQRGLATGVTATFAVGIGAAGAAFAVATQLMLKSPSGALDDGRSAYLEFRAADQRPTGISIPLTESIRESATLLEGLATFDYVGVHASTGEGRPLDVRAYTVFGDYFELLGVVPSAGRLLSAGETGRLGDPFRAVISEHLSRQLFDSPERAVGQRIQVNGQTFSVLGVAGGGFRGTDRAWHVDVWVPRSAFSDLTGYPRERLWSPGSRMNQDFVVRIRPGAAIAAVEAEINRLLERLSSHENSAAGATEARLYPGLNISVSQRQYVRPMLAVLGIAGLLILLIPCANVANLLLMRAIQKRGDNAIRRALGSSAMSIIRLHIAESLILALSGTLFGVAVAWIIVQSLRGHALWGLPPLEGLVLDGRLLVFACGALLLTALLSGIWPAIAATRADPAAAMRDAGHQHTSRYKHIRSAMVAFQLALSLTLLVAGMLLVKTVRNVHSVDAGIGMEGVFVASVHVGAEDMSEAQLSALQQRVLTAVQSTPHVRSAALQSFYGPFSGALSNQVSVAEGPGESSWTQTHWVGPGWLELLGIEMVVGQPFQVGSSAASSAILTSNMATRLFGSPYAALGRTVAVGVSEPGEYRIIGVAEDVRLTDVRREPDEAVFLPYPGQRDPVTVVVRAANEDAQTTERIRHAVEGAAPTFPVSGPTPLRERIDTQITEQRMLVRVLGLFSSFAVALAVVGLYSVVSFSASRRRRELAIRVVLGADSSRIAWEVVRSAIVPIVVGTALGTAGAFLLARLLENRLYGVNAIDVGSYTVAVVGLAVLALAASVLPARHTIRESGTPALKGD